LFVALVDEKIKIKVLASSFENAILKILPVTRFKDSKAAILRLKNAYRKPPVIL
jgi:hypothetical protein